MKVKNKIFIVAEVGVNHNGSTKKALELIDAAAYAGVDAVKFQTYKTENYVTKNAEKAKYQKETTGIAQNQFEMIKELELSFETYYKLKERCLEKGVMFLSTAFDNQSLDFLIHQIDIDLLKIPSGEITNGPYLLDHAKHKKKMIVSTGMCTFDEIETALGVLAFGLLKQSNPSKKSFKVAYASDEGKNILKKYVTLLHCTSNYPAEFEEINLNAMLELKNKFNLQIGYSDHTRGTLVSSLAAAMGAKYIEKHFTLDQQLPGPDHLASLEPEELKNLVKTIRDVEVILGTSLKVPQKSEIQVKKVVRRSIVANEKIKKGDFFNEQNLAIKRPASGRNPMDFWNILGQKSDRDYDPDEIIK